MDLSHLNDPQRLAVTTTEGPLLVLAGAGSGKTRVLIHRIAQIMEQGVPAGAILAITFTNKAAREMKERLEKLCGVQSLDAWVSTFHACCARMLRRDIEKMGYTRNFTIYDDDDQMTVVRDCIKARNLSDKEFVPRDIKSRISDAKNRMLSPEEWFHETRREPRDETIFGLFEEYEHRLRKQNALDFDDLLVKTLDMLASHPPVLDYYRRRFQYILVDEYQDTNAAQYMLVKLLAGERRNLCVVGDDDQSIYGWRGADLRNILDFERDFPDVRIVRLEQNYRSTQNILDAANNVIAHNEGRMEKALWCDGPEGEGIPLYRASDERDEAAWVADRMKALRREGMSVSSMAILYRMNAQSRALEETLVRAGLPYRVYGGLRFYDRKEVKDVVAYLRVVLNPADDISLRRIINVPRRAIGDTTVAAIAECAAARGDSMFGVLLEPGDFQLPARAASATQKFLDLLMQLMALKDTMSLPDFVEYVLDETRFRAQFATDDEENAERLANVKEFEAGVREYQQQNPEGDLESFLENVALVTDLDNAQTAEAATLMTLHSAKGLEFPAVFLVGLEDGLFPMSRAMFDPKKLEEERRLCYVGITRAMQRLFLSFAASRAMFGSTQNNIPSRFLEEIPKRLLEEGRKSAAPARLAQPSAIRPSKTARSSELGIPGVAKGASQLISSVAHGLDPVAQFAPGDRVRHIKFGDGKVISIAGEGKDTKLTIDFETQGRKELSVVYAPIVKLGG